MIGLNMSIILSIVFPALAPNSEESSPDILKSSIFSSDSIFASSSGLGPTSSNILVKSIVFPSFSILIFLFIPSSIIL